MKIHHIKQTAWSIDPSDRQRLPTRRRKTREAPPDRCRENMWGYSTVGRATGTFGTPTWSPDDHRHQTCRRKTQETPPDKCRENIWGISTVGRTRCPYCHPRESLVNQGFPFKMKDSATRPAGVKRGRFPRIDAGKTYGAIAQLVGRAFRTVAPDKPL